MICKAVLPPSGGQYRPFCSQRCQTIDLGNWLGERYIIPGSEREMKDPTPEELDAAKSN